MTEITESAPSAFFATCAKGLEPILVQELEQLGAELVKPALAGAHFHGTIATAQTACLWSRCASRILMPLLETDANADEMYKAVLKFPWFQHMDARSSLWIRFVQGAESNNSNHNIRHSQYGAQRIKDGICDYFRFRDQPRPDVQSRNADISLHARNHRGRVAIALDLSGSSLHQRGYRLDSGAAPLRETLAAALLYRAKWPELAATGKAFLDPMCGSGTLLIEAAMMALDFAPGLQRQHWGFSAWLKNDTQSWQQLVDNARQRYRQKTSQMQQQFPAWKIYGFDKDSQVLQQAQSNKNRTDFDAFIELQQSALTQLPPIESGLCVTNPPYGERLGESEHLQPLYRELGQYLQKLIDWQCAVIVSDKALGKSLSIHSHKQYRFFNGAIPCQLLLFDLKPDRFIDDTKRNQISPEALMICNRLQKNYARIKSWLKTQHIECYRLYDADLPEYAAAIDVYQDHFVVQEYQPPKTIAADKAEFRLRQVHRAIVHYAQQLDSHFNAEQIHQRQRLRQKGNSQYQAHLNQDHLNQDKEPVEAHKNTDRKASKWPAKKVSPYKSNQSPYQGSHENRPSNGDDFMVINEGPLKLYVNLEQYLDTGLFLDHRPLRRMLMEQSKGLDILNLFCYTASISIAAAYGGARSSVNIDMSKTYLRWAADNFDLNHIEHRLNTSNYASGAIDQTQAVHQMLQFDCIKWLQIQSLLPEKPSFDTIVLDPPTFSNSKNMDQTLDIQRDHAALIDASMPLLRSNGRLYFSTNRRGFKMDVDLQDRYQLTDISASTIDKDFQCSQRSQKIHVCWQIGHKR